MPPLNRLVPRTGRALSGWIGLGCIGLASLMASTALASSHREAPLIAGEPRLDSTDLYMFRSYEPGRAGFTTLIANYDPLQDPFGGPNYFALDDQATYDIHVDNVGDGFEHITFRFRFGTRLGKLPETVGGRKIGVPVENTGPVKVGDASHSNFMQFYTVTMVRDGSQMTPLTNASTGQNYFGMPQDNIGAKSFPDYPGYAAQFVYPVQIPGCGAGRIFVGQRKDPFVIALGQVFDLINIAHPIGEQYNAANHDDLADKNVTSLVMEVPTSCLVAKDPVIGAWTTASKVVQPASGSGAPHLMQHSRLGNPLVNELLIAIDDKDTWNTLRPIQQDGGAFLKYVTNPSYPTYVENVFGGAVKAPTAFPREDLVAVFLTGIKGVNQPTNGHALADELRLNTAIAITPSASQNRLGVIGGDNAGFPNGRRPGDDIVDVALRVAMGRLYTLGLFGSPSDAPSGSLDFTDGAFVDASFFDAKFPYLKTPIAGSPGPQPH